MNTNKELHLGILSSIICGRITPERDIQRLFKTSNEAIEGFRNICDSLRVMSFRENETLKMPTSNVRIFEKTHWPYLVTVSYQESTVSIALSDKIKLVTELIATI